MSHLEINDIIQALFIEYKNKYSTDLNFQQSQNSLMFNCPSDFLFWSTELQAEHADWVINEFVRRYPHLVGQYSYQVILSDWSHPVNKTAIANLAKIIQSLPSYHHNKSVLHNILEIYQQQVGKIVK